MQMKINRVNKICSHLIVNRVIAKITLATAMYLTFRLIITVERAVDEEEGRDPVKNYL